LAEQVFSADASSATYAMP